MKIYFIQGMHFSQSKMPYLRKAAESKPVKLETSCTGILSPTTNEILPTWVHVVRTTHKINHEARIKVLIRLEAAKEKLFPSLKGSSVKL